MGVELLGQSFKKNITTKESTSPREYHHDIQNNILINLSHTSSRQ